MSFNNQAYVTIGFQAEIPMVVQVFILSEINMISTLDSSEVDYLQVFELNRKIIAGQVFQEIVVKQEQPPKEHSIRLRSYISTPCLIVQTKIVFSTSFMARI